MYSCRDWSLPYILSQGRNFYRIKRIFAQPLAKTTNDDAPVVDLMNIIERHEQTGEPLILEGFHRNKDWPTDLFTIDWLSQNYMDRDGRKRETIIAKNVRDGSNIEISFKDFIDSIRKASRFADPEEKKRLLSDFPSPSKYSDWLHTSQVIPCRLTPSQPENLLYQFPLTAGVGAMTCTMAVGDTFSRFQKTICGSSSLNLMCYAESGASTFWFMTESSASREVSDYFHHLGVELNHESPLLTLEQLARAPFKVYIGQQDVGDLVLIPPRGYHQIVNYGGSTIKTTWSRMTLRGLNTALYHELPIYHRVCRRDIYHIKSLVHFTMRRLISDLSRIVEERMADSDEDDDPPTSSLSILPASPADNSAISLPFKGSRRSAVRKADKHLRRLVSDLEIVLKLFDRILNEERPGYIAIEEIPVNRPFDDIPLVCHFCGVDVFQSFFDCRLCVPDGQRSDSLAIGDGYVLCAYCYAEGRTCKCEVMTPAQYRPFSLLEAERQKAVDMLTLSWNLCAERPGSKAPSWALSYEDHSQIFQAACMLAQKRKARKPSGRKCANGVATPGYNSHDVPYHWAVPCNQCHHARCYTDLIKTSKMHSVEILFCNNMGDADKKQKLYHKRHHTGKSRFKEGLPGLILSEKRWTAPPDICISLSDCAQRYTFCAPRDPELSKLGWYDKLLSQIQEVSPEIEVSKKSSVSGRRLPGRKRVAQLEVVRNPQSVSQPSTSSLAGEISTQQPSKEEDKTKSPSISPTSSPRSSASSLTPVPEDILAFNLPDTTDDDAVNKVVADISAILSRHQDSPHNDSPSELYSNKNDIEQVQDCESMPKKSALQSFRTNHSRTSSGRLETEGPVSSEQEEDYQYDTAVFMTSSHKRSGSFNDEQPGQKNFDNEIRPSKKPRKASERSPSAFQSYGSYHSDTTRDYDRPPNHALSPGIGGPESARITALEQEVASLRRELAEERTQKDLLLQLVQRMGKSNRSHGEVPSFKSNGFESTSPSRSSLHGPPDQAFSNISKSPSIASNMFSRRSDFRESPVYHPDDYPAFRSPSSFDGHVESHLAEARDPSYDYRDVHDGVKFDNDSSSSPRAAE